ncbi:MAG: hypothetical protein AB1Z98_36420 [Nannocystaceae bacterium]
MAEANAAESNDGAASKPRRPRRTHLINLCCAQSVEEVVEEVARNLRGLGFRVRVVCGAQARTALLGSRAHGDQPMIHVVCVQGSLQERVLKPLRQALATHGGPNHHLFVAVLDLAVPLAMVGQIRRFAEALERPADPQQPGPQGRRERRRWREHSPHRDSERIPTRSYPAVTQVVERPGTQPLRVTEGDTTERPRRKTRSLTARGRAARIDPSSKYKAVTASHQAVPPAEPTTRKRRRHRSVARPAAVVAGTRGRVLDLPEAEAPKPPPPPPPPPPGRRPSSAPLPAADASANALPVGPSPLETVAPEPDRAMPRPAAGLRFTPPGVMAAQVQRTKSERILTTPEPTETHEDGGSETASTLRLEEPPFAPESADRTTRYGQDEIRRRIEAMKAEANDSGDSSTASPKAAVDPGASATVVTTVASMVTSDGGDASASSGSLTASQEQDDRPSRPDKTVLFDRGPTKAADRSPSVDSADELGTKTPAPRETDAPTPRERPASRSAIIPSESAQTLLRPSKPGRDDDDGDVAESDKTLLREDGTFESARTLLRTAQSATPEQPVAMDDDEVTAVLDLGGTPPPADGELEKISEATPPPVEPAADDPDAGGDEAARKKKTVLYAEGDRPRGPTDPASVTVTATATAETERREEDASARDSMKATARWPEQPDDEPAASPRARTKKELEADRAATATVRSDRPEAPKSSSRTWVWVALLLLLGGGGFAAYRAGLLDGALGRDDGSSTTMAAKGDGDGEPPSRTSDAAGPPVTPARATATSGDDSDGPADDDGPTGAGTTGTTGASSRVGTTDAEGGTTGAPALASTTGATDATPADDATGAGSTGEAPEPDEGTTGDGTTEAAEVPPETPPAGTPRLTPDEQVLAAAADERRIVMLKTLFVSRNQGESTTWFGGNQRCGALEVDGIGGWRLPHRREMKLINVVLSLPRGVYWTYTVPDEDRRAAYVLDTDTNGLSLFLKQEPTGEVLCVRRRVHPDAD